MHTIDLLEEALWLANQTGWQVRHEWLGGSRGGACRLGSKHFLFVDRSLTAAEQLEQVLEGLRDHLERSIDGDVFTARFRQSIDEYVLSDQLKRGLGLRHSRSTLEDIAQPS